jgi:hypothetical protein
MPSATAFFPDLTPYFKLDGSRTITGATTLTNTLNVSGLLTLGAGAAVTGSIVASGDITAGGAFTGQTAALSRTLSVTQPLLYGLTTYVESAPSGVMTDLAGLYNTAYHLGSGLVTTLEGAQFYTRATGPVTTHYGQYTQADSRAAVTNLYGGYIQADHISGSIATGMTGLYVRANLTSGSVPTLVGLDVVVTGSGSSTTQAIRAVGGGMSIAADTDATTILGRTRIDSRASDLAYFSHYDRSGTSDYALRQDAAGTTVLNGTASLGIVVNNGNSGPVLNLSSTGFRVGGTGAAGSTLHTITADAVTNAVTNVLTIGHNSSGTPAASFGVGLLFQSESSTTENQNSAVIESLWQTATHASRAADLVLSAYNVANKREGIRIRGGASGAELAFFGGTPAAKPALGAWAGLTTDQKLDALRDALNTLSLASYS